MPIAILALQLRGNFSKPISSRALFSLHKTRRLRDDFVLLWSSQTHLKTNEANKLTRQSWNRRKKPTKMIGSGSDSHVTRSGSATKVKMWFREWNFWSRFDWFFYESCTKLNQLAKRSFSRYFYKEICSRAEIVMRSKLIPRPRIIGVDGKAK